MEAAGAQSGLLSQGHGVTFITPNSGYWSCTFSLIIISFLKTVGSVKAEVFN